MTNTIGNITNTVAMVRASRSDACENRFGTPEQSLLLVASILFMFSVSNCRVSALVVIPQSAHFLYVEMWFWTGSDYYTP